MSYTKYVCIVIVITTAVVYILRTTVSKYSYSIIILINLCTNLKDCLLNQ